MPFYFLCFCCSDIWGFADPRGTVPPMTSQFSEAGKDSSAGVSFICKPTNLKPIPPPPPLSDSLHGATIPLSQSPHGHTPDD